MEFKTFDEYFTDPKPCNALKHVRDHFESEEGIAETQAENRRQLEIWDGLGGLIFGAEDSEGIVD